jgi:hypothetical protein
MEPNLETVEMFIRRKIQEKVVITTHCVVAEDAVGKRGGRAHHERVLQQDSESVVRRVVGAVIYKTLYNYFEYYV